MRTERERERERERKELKGESHVQEGVRREKGAFPTVGKEWPWQLGGRFTGSLRGSSRDNVVGGPLDRHLDAKLNDRRYLEPEQNKLLPRSSVDTRSTSVYACLED